MRYLPLCLALTACATFGQQPKPVGEPGPVACIGAKSAEQAWMELDIYMRQVLRARIARGAASGRAGSSVASGALAACVGTRFPASMRGERVRALWSRAAAD